jgi:hypothetical protein
MPIVPITLLLLFADLANSRTIRAYYVRNLEEELRRLSGISNHIARPQVGLPLTPAVYGELNASLFGQRRGLPRYRISLVVIYLVVSASLLALTVLALRTARPIDLQIVGILVYLSLLGLLARLLWLGTIGSRHLWADAVKALDITLTSNTGPQTPGPSRGLVSYLILPRPNEMLARAPIVPLSYLLAAITLNGFTADGLWSSIVAGLVFEYFVYQARYVINDLRGFTADAAFSAFKAKTRFPIPVTRASISLAIYSCVIRLGLALWIDIRAFHSAALVGIIGVLVIQAMLYEIARARVEAGSSAASFCRLSSAKVAVYLLAGAGYALRGAIGIAIAARTYGSAGFLPGAMYLQLGAWWLFGIMTVTAAWSFVLADQVIGQSLPSGEVRLAAQRLAHLGPLGLQARVLRPDCSFVDQVFDATSGLRVGQLSLLKRVGGPTWWNLCYWAIVPIVSGSVVAVAHALSGAGVATVVCVSAVAAVIVGVSVGAQLPLPGVRVSLQWPALLLACAVLWLVSERLGLGIRTCLLLVGALFVNSLIYIFFRLASLNGLQRSPDERVRALGRAYRRGFALAVGAIAGPSARDKILNG